MAPESLPKLRRPDAFLLLEDEALLIVPSLVKLFVNLIIPSGDSDVLLCPADAVVDGASSDKSAEA